MMEQTSTELYGVPWHHVRTEELLRLLQLNKTNGEKRIKEFQNRRIVVRERQDFLQQRRIARLRMEGIIIDLEAVRRRCKAPKESLWYEDVDEAEKQKLMKRRLKDMFKTQYCVRRIEQKVDTSSDESSDDNDDDTDSTVADKQPQRGQILRNYTQMYKRDQGNDKPEKEKKQKRKASGNKKTSDNKLNDDKEQKNKTSDNDDVHAPTDPTDVVKESIAKLNSISESNKNPPPGRFRKAVKRVTALNRLGRGSWNSRTISPVLEVPNLGSKSRNSSAGSGRSKTPKLPRINSGGSSKT